MSARVASPLFLALYAGLYVVCGVGSFSSAYLQPNSATVWVPSGLAFGLLLIKGRQYWPSIFFGSWLLNLGVLLRGSPEFHAGFVAAALAIAIGNTAEALLSAGLTERFANGRSYPFRTRSVLTFVVLCATLPPLVSTSVGVGTTVLFGLPVTGDINDVALLWYIANAQSLVLFGSLIVLLPETLADVPDNGKILEGVGFSLVLCLAVLLVGGVVTVAWLQAWPKTYMLIPFVVWASFRFGSIGGLISVLVITVTAAAETIHGYEVFPGETPWWSLMYLQVYLAMLSLVALTMGAALAERDEMAADLENRINARTSSLRSLLDHNRLSIALAAHDLKSPVLELRAALADYRAQIQTGAASSGAAMTSLAESEATCTRLLNQIAKFLAVNESERTNEADGVAPLEDIVLASFAAHRVSARAKNLALEVEVRPDLEVWAASEVELILNTLLENAIHHAPPSSRICVSGERRDDRVRITVRDEGPGVAGDKLDSLFQPPPVEAASAGLDRSGRSGLGLFLAHKQADWIGGALTYVPDGAGGATFMLEL
jgi:integral membrane sensor domain MASE1/anti-sigma regulatory factor (Ser/Thr protein kinase)